MGSFLHFQWPRSKLGDPWLNVVFFSKMENLKFEKVGTYSTFENMFLLNSGEGANFNKYIWGFTFNAKQFEDLNTKKYLEMKINDL